MLYKIFTPSKSPRRHRITKRPSRRNAIIAFICTANPISLLRRQRAPSKFSEQINATIAYSSDNLFVLESCLKTILYILNNDGISSETKHTSNRRFFFRSDRSGTLTVLESGTSGQWTSGVIFRFNRWRPLTISTYKLPVVLSSSV